MNNFSTLQEKIIELPSLANYWMIRTEGGDYYNSFINGNYIAIGYNEVTLKELEPIGPRKLQAKGLSMRIQKLYPDHGRPTFAANVLLRFVNDLKKDDYVVIPSKNSQFVSFGQVIDSKTYLKNELKQDDQVPFEKRKKIKWLKTVKRDDLNPYLFKLFHTRGAVANANDYEDYINKTIYGLFRKNNLIHLVLNVRAKHTINARKLFNFGNNIFELTDEFGNDNELKLPTDNVEIKLSLQSPGFIEIISYSVPIIGILGAIIVACSGGTIKIGLKTGVEFSSEGILNSISKFLDARQERKIKAKKLEGEIEEFELKTPQELKEALSKRKEI